MYLIYNTKEEADTLNDRISDAMELPKGNTLQYGNVIKHSTKNQWALVINNGGENYLTQTEIDLQVNLPSDWYPESEI